MPGFVVNHQCRGGNPIDQGRCGSCFAITAADTAAVLRGLSCGSYKRLSAQ